MSNPKWEDYGESSLTLLAVHVGMDKKEPSVPRDPSDFRRCMHLFECMGLNEQQKKELLKKAAEKYPIWKIFKLNWRTMEAFYDMEKEQEEAPELYDFMKRLEKWKK